MNTIFIFIAIFIQSNGGIHTEVNIVNSVKECDFMAEIINFNNNEKEKNFSILKEIDPKAVNKNDKLIYLGCERYDFRMTSNKNKMLRDKT